jgi:hypothetical protein
VQSNTQIIWGKTKIIDIEHTPQYKIDSALIIVCEALDGKRGFGYGKFIKRYTDNGKPLPFDESGFKKCKSNYNMIRRALSLLATNGYVTHSTLLPNGTIKVQWFEGYTKPAPNEHVNQPAKMPDLSQPNTISPELLAQRFLYYKYRPSLTKRLENERIGDEIGSAKSYLDGDDKNRKRGHGITIEQYEESLAIKDKVDRLPKDYMTLKGETTNANIKHRKTRKGKGRSCQNA